MTIAAVLLAAGASRRYGSSDKLLAPLWGTPLVVHAARALRSIAPAHLIAVVRSDDVARVLTGFTITTPKEDAPDQADSLRAGVALASSCGASRILVALGDMPFVTADLLKDVVAACTDARPGATTDGDRITPPACFPIIMAAQLMALKGDRGAASLLCNLPARAVVEAEAALLRDIDSPDMLHVAQACSNDTRT